MMVIIGCWKCELRKFLIAADKKMRVSGLNLQHSAICNFLWRIMYF